MFKTGLEPVLKQVCQFLKVAKKVPNANYSRNFRSKVAKFATYHQIWHTAGS